MFLTGGGYPVQSIVNQEWKEVTGRFNANWTPKLDFTDQTLIYASYSHGYKGGGANPPGPQADFVSAQSSTTHPPTFAPEFINAFELGTKNTLLDGAVTLNGNTLKAGDGAAISDEAILELVGVEDAELLLFDLA